MSTWNGEGGYGEVEFTWSDNLWGSNPPEGHVGSLDVQEPYRETGGHSAWITPAMARGLAAELIEFADWAEANPPAPPFRPSN